MNPRRSLLLTAAAAFAGQVTQPRAQAPAPTPRRVGVLAPSTQAKEEITLKPFFDRMRENWWST